MNKLTPISYEPEESIWTQILASHNRPVKISYEDLISLIYYDFSKP